MDLESLGTWALRTERDSREPRRESNGVILELCSRKYLRPTGQALSRGAQAAQVSGGRVTHLRPKMKKYFISNPRLVPSQGYF